MKEYRLKAKLNTDATDSIKNKNRNNNKINIKSLLRIKERVCVSVGYAQKRP